MRYVIIPALLLLSQPVLESGKPHFVTVISEVHLFRQRTIESSDGKHLYGKDGELGAYQIKLSTARKYNARISKKELLKYTSNSEIASRHIRYLFLKYSEWGFTGDRLLLLVFTAFNRGEWKTDSLLRVGENPVNNYARRIVYGDEVSKMWSSSSGGRKTFNARNTQ